MKYEGDPRERCEFCLDHNKHYVALKSRKIGDKVELFCPQCDRTLLQLKRQLKKELIEKHDKIRDLWEAQNVLMDKAENDLDSEIATLEASSPNLPEKEAPKEEEKLPKSPSREAREVSHQKNLRAYTVNEIPMVEALEDPPTNPKIQTAPDLTNLANNPQAAHYIQVATAAALKAMSEGKNADEIRAISEAAIKAEAEKMKV